MRKMEENKPTSEGVSRRKFLKAVALSSGAVAAGSLLAGCAGQAATSAGGGAPSGAITLDLTKPENQALAATGGSVALEANALDPLGIFVLRTGAASVQAFSRKCTHLGCAVGAFQGAVATCPCHGSQYDSTGAVLKGPAPSPLKKYQAVLSGSTITIS
jgi:cytochrome b6-f complex iron-sulfur subunit